MDTNLQELLKLSETTSKQINLQMQIMDKTFKSAIQNLPKEKADKMEDIKIKTQQAINLAKGGNIRQAQDILKNLTKWE